MQDHLREVGVMSTCMFFYQKCRVGVPPLYSARKQGRRPIRESPVPEHGMELSTSSSGRARLWDRRPRLLCVMVLCDRYLPPIARARGFWAPRVRAFDFQDLTTKCIHWLPFTGTYIVRVLVPVDLYR